MVVYCKHMRKDKENAIEMRRNGMSYKQIHAALKIPVSTLSDWFGNVDWSKKITERLVVEMNKYHRARLRELNRVRGAHLREAYKEAEKEAADDFEKLKYHPLFIAGLMLYWGEGDKTTKASVRLSNTDPNLIRLYSFFLTHVCRIPENMVRCSLILYPDLEERECVNFWSERSGILRERFLKSTYIRGRHKTKRLGYGVCIVYVQSTYFKKKMLVWLDLLPRQLMGKQYYENI